MHIPYWDLRCEKCNDLQKEVRGCEKEGLDGGYFEIGEWKIERCPIKMVTQNTQQYLQAYSLIQLGQWPYGNGWLRNSNKFIEAVAVINCEIKKLEAKVAKEQKK